MILETHKILCFHPYFYTADNGFYKTEALYYLFYHNINVIMPDRNQSSKMKNKNPDNIFKKSNFQYDYINDTFTCPKNKTLEYINNRKINKDLYRVYSTNDCQTCDYLKKCTKGKKREIFHTANPLKNKMSENYDSDWGRNTYKKKVSYRGIILRNASIFS